MAELIACRLNWLLLWRFVSVFEDLAETLHVFDFLVDDGGQLPVGQRSQRLRGQVEQSRNVGHAHGLRNYAQFIQPAAMFHQVGKCLSVARSVGLVKPGGNRLIELVISDKPHFS